MQVKIITTDEPAETITGTYVDENEDDIQVEELGEQRVIPRDRISHYSVIEEGDDVATEPAALTAASLATPAPAATEIPTFPPTAAQRYWDENRERLEAAVTARKVALRMHAEAMTIADLRAVLEAHNESTNDRYLMVKLPAKTAPKEDYGIAFVASGMKGCDEEKAVQAARYAVIKEEGVERSMQMLVAQRDAEVAKVREALADPDPAQAAYALAYRLELHADDIQSATYAARIAQQYLDRRAEGVEPAVLAKYIATQAIGVLAELPRSGSNLRVNSHGIAEVAKAAAHREVLGKVAPLLDEAAQNLLNVWF